MADKLESYATIPPESPEYGWRPFLPTAEVVVLVGKRGIGKGMLESAIASAFTTGAPLPGDDAIREPSNVVLAMAEDDPNKVMAWRLRAAHADLSRVFNATDALAVPSGIARLRRKIEQIGNVSLVILDPFTAFSEVPLGASNDRVRNELMTPLREQLAEPLGITLLCTVHVTKEGKTVGSGAIEDVPRMVLKVERMRSNPDIRRLYIEKSNLGTDDAQVFYTITGTGDTDGHAVFLDDNGATPEQDQSAPGRIVEALHKASEPQSARELSQSLGIPYGTVRTALSRLGDDAGSGVFSPKRGVWWSHDALEALARGDAT